MTTHVAEAAVPTTSASRYLQQLCKHWSHKFATAFNAESGEIVFPRDARGASYPADAVVNLTATPATLEVRVRASDARQLEGVKSAVASHLDRFAFREAPLAFEWR